MTRRKARAKSEPKTGKGSCRNEPKQNYFSTLMDTPEGRELRRQWSTKKRKTGRPKAYLMVIARRRSTYPPERKRAEKAVNIMSEKFDIKDDYAKNALQTAVEIMEVPGETRERLAAARLVLDFCAAKPASKQEVTIGKAEEFLASILEEEDDSGSEATTGS